MCLCLLILSAVVFKGGGGFRGKNLFFVVFLVRMFGWYGGCMYFFLRHKHPVIELAILCIFEGAIFLLL